MFALDQNAARAADNKSAFIDEAGKYVGAFTRAEYMEKSDTGSTGIGFTFKTREGAEAQFYVNLTYQHGTRNKGGYDLINALMACMQLLKVGDPKPVEVEKWDSETKQRVKTTVNGFPDLMNKPVGLLLQMEIEKNSQNGNARPTIYAPFSAESEKTASEICDRTATPAKLEKMVQAVMQRPLIDRRPKDKQTSGGTATEYGDNYARPDDTDDIPW